MPHTPELQMLLQHLSQRRDQAQSALRRAADTARRAQEQAALLCGYRGEYQSRWSAQFTQGGTIEIMRCYRSFTQRLDQAVALQSRQAELAATSVEQARADLLECERKVAAVRKLIERRGAEHAQHSRRREQQRTDELAQRLHAGQSPQDGGALR